MSPLYHYWSAPSWLIFFYNLDSIACHYNYSFIRILSSLILLSFYCSADQPWLGVALESSEGLLKAQIAEPYCRVSESGGLGWGLGICISYQLLMILTLLVWGPCTENHCFAAVTLTEPNSVFSYLQPSSWMQLKKNYKWGDCFCWNSLLLTPDEPSMTAWLSLQISLGRSVSPHFSAFSSQISNLPPTP